MSNTIKLKRGSGSDPSASDLSVGEVALRTDNGKLFTKKDDSSVVQIGGGSGAIDDGAITNAKVASDAAIAGTKISPNFSGQNIVNTGTLSTGNATATKLTISGSTVPQIIFNDSNDNPDFSVRADVGSFRIKDTTSNVERLIINSDGDVQIPADNAKLEIGASQDLEIYHNGTDSYIDNATGITRIRNTGTNGSQIQLLNSNSGFKIQALTGEQSILGVANGQVELYYDNSKKLETTSAGATVTGTLTATTFSGSGASLTSLNASNISSGTIPAARVGDITGNAASADTVDVSGASNQNASFMPLFVDNTGSAKTIKADGDLTYNPSTNTLSADTFSGSGASLTDVNAASLSGITSGSFLRSNADDVATHRIRFENCQTDDHDTIATSTGSLGCIEIKNTGSGNDAFMAFHAGGDFAFYFGLDADSNKLAVGGWSMGANKYAIYHEGNNPSYNDLSNLPTIPTNNNQLSNGAGYVTSSGNTVIGTDSDINTSGATVIDQLNMTDGVIQSHSTRTMTLANLGYTGATNANYITNNNQLSNGAGYITSVSGQNYNSLSNKPTIPTNNNQLSNGAGYITSGSDRACRAWVNFRGNSSVTRNDHANVSSVSDNGVGHYTVSFSSSMPNSSYCVTVGFMDDAGNSNVAKIVDNSLGTGSFQIRTGSFQDGSGNTDRDFDGVFCAVFAG